MSVVVTATSATIANGSGSSRTISYAHTAGKDLCAIVLWKSNSVTLSSVTYNSVAMSLIVASGQSGADPGLSASAYRINDPGGMTANLIVNYTTGTPANINVYILDVAGCPPTSPLDSFGSNVDTVGTTIDLTCTYTRIAGNTLTVISGVRSRGATTQSFTGDNGATEVADEDNGTNPGLGTSLYTLQETTSGSLTRGITASSGGKFAIVCLSYTTAGQPTSKRFGLIRPCQRIRGVW